MLKEIIDLLNGVEILIRSFCRRAGELWDGYVQYNLSRAYELLYKYRLKEGELDTDQILDKVRESSLYAISTRQHWVNNGLKGMFSTALSYEYFLALHHEYNLRERICDYSPDSREKTSKEVRETLAEISVYCETTGLEKLFTMKSNFEKMVKRFS